MKSLTKLIYSVSIIIAVFICNGTVHAQQQYKLRQVTSMTGMKSETVIYVKGMRKRTEGSGYMNMQSLTTIEQCDMQRIITINDKKKLYFIEPFSKYQEVVIDENVKTAKTKSASYNTKDGGIITNYYSIRDTGERKKMFGFTARRIWTTQKLIPSANACMMKDSMIIKTDGWYIDFPDFNCQVSYGSSSANGGYQKPDCQDRFVTRKSGKGKFGFALMETKTMIMGGQIQTSEFVTDLVTLELNTEKPDSLLFEIPAGYKEAKSIEELQEKLNIADMMGGVNSNEQVAVAIDATTPKKTGAIRIGVLPPTGEDALLFETLSNTIATQLTTGNVEAVLIGNNDEAVASQCDYILSTAFTKFKQVSKAGGLLKAIRNADPSAINSYNVSVSMLLKKTTDETFRSNIITSGKYEGKQQEAAVKALGNSCRDLLKELE